MAELGHPPIYLQTCDKSLQVFGCNHFALCKLLNVQYQARRSQWHQKSTGDKQTVMQCRAAWRCHLKRTGCTDVSPAICDQCPVRLSAGASLKPELAPQANMVWPQQCKVPGRNLSPGCLQHSFNRCAGSFIRTGATKHSSYSSSSESCEGACQRSTHLAKQLSGVCSKLVSCSKGHRETDQRDVPQGQSKR